MPWWLRGLRIQSCHSCGSSHCCGMGLITGPGTPMSAAKTSKWIKRDFYSRSPLYRLCRWSFNNFIYTSVLEFGLYILITNRLTKTLLLKYVENPLFERASSKPTWRRQYVWTHASVHPHPPDSSLYVSWPYILLSHQSVRTDLVGVWYEQVSVTGYQNGGDRFWLLRLHLKEVNIQ